MNIILSLLLLLPLLSACGSPTKTQNTASVIPSNNNAVTLEEMATSTNVSIKDFSFSPEFIKIKKGTTVTWVNNDQVIHRIKSSIFSSNLINPGQSFSFTFNEVGQVEYYCPIHQAMNGQIIIE